MPGRCGQPEEPACETGHRLRSGAVYIAHQSSEFREIYDRRLALFLGQRLHRLARIDRGIGLRCCAVGARILEDALGLRTRVGDRQDGIAAQHDALFLTVVPVFEALGLPSGDSDEQVEAAASASL